ncbi:MAG: hypothetical protein NVS4B12_16810 [Ktedonobacteraceae bacterium]
MDQQSHTQGVKQNYSQRRLGDIANTRNPRRDISEDEEYDDVWPSRMPTSARRYQSDVRAETGRTLADVQLSSQREHRTGSNPAERTGGNTIPPRRTATQSMPVVQTPRRAVQQNVPVVQSPRRLVTQNMSAVPATRRRPIEDFEDDVPVRTSGLLREPQVRRGRRFHWLVYVGLAMIGMLVCWIVLTTFLGWWQVTKDDLQYGRPRTSQYDYVVGHGDSNANKSHFIALNLRRHVEVIECPAGDCTKAKVLIGPMLIGPNQDLAPVTLTFKDVNGDGKPDIIVNVQDSHYVFINDNGTFRPTRQSDNIHL